MWYFSYLTSFFFFPPLGSLVPDYVIKDAAEENYEFKVIMTHDYWLYGTLISTEFSL